MELPEEERRRPESESRNNRIARMGAGTRSHDENAIERRKR
jgi:hypothetical protein